MEAVRAGGAGRRIQSEYSQRGSRLLTEQQISRSWIKLFTSGEVDEAMLERAESLLAELRPESPLRHRLGLELEEIRNRFLQAQR